MPQIQHAVAKGPRSILPGLTPVDGGEDEQNGARGKVKRLPALLSYAGQKIAFRGMKVAAGWIDP